MSENLIKEARDAIGRCDWWTLGDAIIALCALTDAGDGDAGSLSDTVTAILRRRPDIERITAALMAAAYHAEAGSDADTWSGAIWEALVTAQPAPYPWDAAYYAVRYDRIAEKTLGRLAAMILSQTVTHFGLNRILPSRWPYSP